jgi:hypothetical protein
MAKGYSQVEGLNFDETFAPVARLESIRILLAHATHLGFKLYQMGVKSAFLIGKVYSTLLTRKMGKYLFVCQIYIDDIIFDSTNKSFCDEFSKIMTDRFEMSMMRVLTFFLGLQRNKIQLPYPRPKRSKSPPVVVVYNYFGRNKLSRTMVIL